MSQGAMLQGTFGRYCVATKPRGSVRRRSRWSKFLPVCLPRCPAVVTEAATVTTTTSSRHAPSASRLHQRIKHHRSAALPATVPDGTHSLIGPSNADAKVQLASAGFNLSLEVEMHDKRDSDHLLLVILLGVSQ